MIEGRVAQPSPENNSETVTIGLISGPIHNDFLLPLDERTRTQFAALASPQVPIYHPNAAWLLIGWGARDFYTTVGRYQDVSAGAVLRGIFGDRSVIRTEVLGTLGDSADIRWLQLRDHQYQDLIAGIGTDIVPDPQPITTDGATHGAFFAATDRFHAFNTCNVWVGRKLRDSGVRFGAWTPLPASVSLSLWRFHSQ
ncbi:TIGR02117 family protein [Thalassobius sp. Cn5-15]|nr:TIGR02117 family protein [Thalassobius sp. Cn5-15]